jgi:hypothetical protein
MGRMALGGWQRPWEKEQQADVTDGGRENDGVDLWRGILEQVADWLSVTGKIFHCIIRDTPPY